MWALQLLPILFLCLGLGQSGRSRRDELHQCLYPEELEVPGRGLQKLLRRASTGLDPSPSLVQQLEQKPRGHCPKVGQRAPGNADISHRSISPWEYRIDQDEDRYPPKLAFARCLCDGCIDAETGEETLALTSVPLEHRLLVLQRRPCPGRAGRYSFELEYITVPVGCTCVVPRGHSAPPA